MECNKEAAIQARELAESKLLLKDYKAAQKFCVKAQSLFPNLENLTQLLTVCSVHCSALDKINNETDWYGVLQVGTTADELAIKKQYRKLALLLHPDKNKFPGAESAFKLIGEANTILTDRGKRSLHDLKRSGRNNNNAQIRRPSQAARQTGQTSQASQQTFWTICTTCGMRYQHFRNVYRRALRCQNCMQTFVAYDINEQPVQTQNPNNRNPNPSPMYSFNRPNGSATAGNSNPFQRPSPIFTQFQPGAGTSTGTAESMKFEKVNLEKGANAKPSPAGASFANKPPVNPPKSNPPKRTQPQKKKRKRVVEEDEEEEEESEADSSESEEEIVLEKEVKMNGTSDPPRRSSRRKNDVKYNEKDNIDEDLEDGLEDDDDDVSDDDDAEVDVVDDDITVMYARKRLRKESDRDKDKRSVPNEKEKEKDVKMNEKEKETEIKTKEKEKGKAKQTEGSESESESEPKEFVYSEPEFFNFDGLRARTRFAADQVWAAYDSLDGMPRFYALIKTVRHAPAFHLKFTWLESDPSSRSAAAWTRADLPVACGSFVTGSVETTDELLMFSHMVDYSKGGRGKRGAFEIFPKKGEIWAVFKDWDENWSADPEAHGHESFEYEIVEVLSDLGDSTGFVVTRLVRVSGFVSVFVRESEKAPFVVPATEILRFSHRVPAYRMSGEEREKVPPGAFELDQASLPCDLDKAFGSVELDLKGKEKVSNGEKREKLNGSLSNGKSKEKVDEKLHGNLEKKMNETVDRKSNGNSKEKLNGSLNNGKSKEKLGEKLDRKSKAKLSENSDKKSRDKPNEKSDENSISDSVRTNENSNAESPEYTYSEAEFYIFAMDRTIHKFQAGQIWALYSDVDQFPKFYGWVKRVDPLHEKIHIRWLEPIADGLTGEAKRWVDRELPIGCGSFEITGSTVSFYNSAFSHLVSASRSGKRRYEISPGKDEIWAIYRNWTVGWKLEDIKDSCQYEVVQVAEVNEKGIKVEILKKVDGHSAVFARDRARKGMLVPKGEYVRFSHRIPSYRLGEEENGTLRGCFELDSASVPEDLL